MSLFITFEGGEGGGKSTQANILVERLRKEKKWRVIYAEEPGTTLLGKMLKEWLRDRNRSLTLIPKDETQLSLVEQPLDDNLLPDILLHAVAPRAELLAFTIARAQLVEEIIIPNLKNNNIVVCNRYADSTTAYQGYGRGLDLKLIRMANEVATQGIKPDLTILLDLSPEDGLARKFGTSKEDHFEKQVLDFHQRVRTGFLTLAKEEPDRWLVVDAAQSKEKIAEIIWRKVSQLLSKKL
ncbi:MAG: dTMP kinase [Chloroflexota bacterium]|nr:dTMP kinase [Chloroflexota bacterium]